MRSFSSPGRPGALPPRPPLASRSFSFLWSSGVVNLSARLFRAVPLPSAASAPRASGDWPRPPAPSASASFLASVGSLNFPHRVLSTAGSPRSRPAAARPALRAARRSRPWVKTTRKSGSPSKVSAKALSLAGSRLQPRSASTASAWTSPPSVPSTSFVNSAAEAKAPRIASAPGALGIASRKAMAWAGLGKASVSLSSAGPLSVERAVPAAAMAAAICAAPLSSLATRRTAAENFMVPPARSHQGPPCGDRPAPSCPRPRHPAAQDRPPPRAAPRARRSRCRDLAAVPIAASATTAVSASASCAANRPRAAAMRSVSVACCATERVCVPVAAIRAAGGGLGLVDLLHRGLDGLQRLRNPGQAGNHGFRPPGNGAGLLQRPAVRRVGQGKGGVVGLERLEAQPLRLQQGSRGARRRGQRAAAPGRRRERRGNARGLGLAGGGGEGELGLQRAELDQRGLGPAQGVRRNRAVQRGEFRHGRGDALALGAEQARGQGGIALRHDLVAAQQARGDGLAREVHELAQHLHGRLRIGQRLHGRKRRQGGQGAGLEILDGEQFGLVGARGGQRADFLDQGQAQVLPGIACLVFLAHGLPQRGQAVLGPLQIFFARRILPALGQGGGAQADLSGNQRVGVLERDFGDLHPAARGRVRARAAASASAIARACASAWMRARTWVRKVCSSASARSAATTIALAKGGSRASRMFRVRLDISARSASLDKSGGSRAATESLRAVTRPAASARWRPRDRRPDPAHAAGAGHRAHEAPGIAVAVRSIRPREDDSAVGNHGGRW